MTTTIIQEFIQALNEEMEAIKKRKGGRTAHIFNGKFLREFRDPAWQRDPTEKARREAHKVIDELRGTQ